MKYSGISEFFKFEVKNSFRVICPYPLACPCVYKHKHLIFSIWGYTSSKRVSQQTPPWLAPYPIEEFTLSRFLPRIHSFRWTIYLGKNELTLISTSRPLLSSSCFVKQKPSVFFKGLFCEFLVGKSIEFI